MKNLQNVIDNYLSKSTDFAVQIVGSWGYGKTYYYRETLEKFIFEKETHSNAKKTYKPIYISLFGLKTIEDIATKIVLDFYQSIYFKDYFKRSNSKKRLKITQSVLKIGFRGFLSFTRLGNVTDYITDIKNIGENVLNTDELVICFDDLERKDSTLNFGDLAGYINSLVDEGIKVIIISNEDLLLKSEDNYKDLKEKIIGITVEYIPNTEETLNNIIEKRYSTFPVYFQYLKDNFDDFVRLTNAINNNFRHVVYALDCLHICYSKIRQDILDLNDDIKDKVLLEIKNISIMICALAIEYKSSILKHNDFSDYKIAYLQTNEFLKGLSQNNNGDNEKSKIEVFLDKYKIAKDQYHLYETIYKYVTGYSEFNIKDFALEFKKEFNLEQGKVLPQYELLNALSYQSCFKLSDIVYEEKTLSAIEYANKGKYAAPDYLTIMHYSERFNNILNLNLEDVKNRLLVGLRISINNIQSSSDPAISQFEMSGKMGELSDINRQLYNTGIDEIEQFNRNHDVRKIEEIINLLTSNPPEFHRQRHTNNEFSYHLSTYPLLNYISPESFFEKVKNADNGTIHFMMFFFKDKYAEKDKLKDEYQNFSQFTDLIIDYNRIIAKEQGQKIRSYVVNELSETLALIRDNGAPLGAGV